MLYCDQQREGCKIWYHYDCLGSGWVFLKRTLFVLFALTILPLFMPALLLVGQPPQLGARDSIQFKPCTDFLWNNVSGEQVCDFLISAYEQVVHWRRNVFLIPFGKPGKLFVKELARLYQAFAEDTALSSIALMACSVLQPLLLQKPHKNSKANDHSVHLLRRLELWNQGSFDVLINEGSCIQDHLKRGMSVI